MARELRRAMSRRRLSLAAAACVLVASVQAGTAAASQWPHELPWTCDQNSGRVTTLSLASTVYNRPVAASVYLPPCYNRRSRPIPVIYLLHGANTDETQWPDVGVQSAADAMIAQGAPPFVVVMPAGPYQNDIDYESFVLKDLIPGIEGRLRVSQEGTGRAIGGISLGGYWALKTAFEHPDLFAAVGGHSPVTIRTGGPNDPATLASNAPGLERLRITLDVGDMDSLRAATEQLARTLRARGLAVALSVNHGGHNRPYWRLHTAEYLGFYMEALTAHAQPSPPGCDFLERHL
jgi:enterochelin esterase-like enzyme